MTATEHDQRQRPWVFAIDTGGTFTDCLGLSPEGIWHRAKVLSIGAIRGKVTRVVDDETIEFDAAVPQTDGLFVGYSLKRLSGGDVVAITAYEGRDRRIHLSHLQSPLPTVGDLVELTSGEEAPILAMRMITGTPLTQPLPSVELRLGTTRGTNALLERAGGRVAMFLTRGFHDQLVIGDQTRPDLFARRIDRPKPYFDTAVEVAERIDASGNVIRPIDLQETRIAAEVLLMAGITHAAVALVNAWRNPEHEEALAAQLREVGFQHVTTSSSLSRTIKFLPRATAACINAYLAPVFESYLGSIHTAMREGALHVMTSAGGLVRAETFQPCDSLLSGPAGGVRGVLAVAEQEQLGSVVGFDMGGTSTDVCRCDGEISYRYETIVGDARLTAPSVAIETVAAGGGSICEFRDGHLCVGPRSAGASPGPACYGAGGPLTITDVNLLLGRLDSSRFELPLDGDAAERALTKVINEVEHHSGHAPEREALLEGFLALADEAMADAIRQVSVKQGFAPKDHALIAFGGAAGQHACRIAELLGIQRVVFPGDASILSTVGLMNAPIECHREMQILKPLDAVAASFEDFFNDLLMEAVNGLKDAGIGPNEHIKARRLASLRLKGQDSTIELSDDELDQPAASFVRRYELQYGHQPASIPIEVESIRLVASSQSTQQDFEKADTSSVEQIAPVCTRSVWMSGSWHEAPVYERSHLVAGSIQTGPAVILGGMTVTLIEPSWTFEMRASGTLLANHVSAHRPPLSEAHDQLTAIELFANRFMSIAEEAGRLLERTALSTNVKERRDFSIAMLDADGALLVSAPHIPVHLGALGPCVQAVMSAVQLRSGDVAVTNHPAFGGSHLPDVTIITPVDTPDGKRLGYFASRAHHAEIGGKRPGSMPADGRTLAEEGVVIVPQHLIAQGHPRYDVIEQLLRAGPFPSRAIKENIADLHAQVAANRYGAERLLEMETQLGTNRLTRAMRMLRERAGQLAREALRTLPQMSRSGSEVFDDGTTIRVRVERTGERVLIDFTGTDPVHPGNLNATPAIVRSAVMYVLRLLAGSALPLNEGLLDAVKLVIPGGTFLNPEFSDDPSCSPAVVGGNVETSQRIVNLLLRTFDVMADSQGTMNNLVFGTDQFGYYETIGGGCGAGANFDGACGVHSHMTNTRITDVEILEHRYPVRLERFALRRGSGGAGRRRGGDGLVREMIMLAPVTISILSQHRQDGPAGKHGGASGLPGRQWIDRADSVREDLASNANAEMNAGDRLTIETPGGGGWGTAT